LPFQSFSLLDRRGGKDCPHQGGCSATVVQSHPCLGDASHATRNVQKDIDHVKNGIVNRKKDVNDTKKDIDGMKKNRRCIVSSLAFHLIDYWA